VFHLGRFGTIIRLTRDMRFEIRVCHRNWRYYWINAEGNHVFVD